MPARTQAGLDHLIATGAFAEVRERLRREDRAALARDWAAFSPLHKLALFKLMDASSALDFYRRLSFAERYFLLCGFPLSAIAPLLEGLPPGTRRCFVQLPAGFYGRMLRALSVAGPEAAR